MVLLYKNGEKLRVFILTCMGMKQFWKNTNKVVGIVWMEDSDDV